MMRQRSYLALALAASAASAFVAPRAAAPRSGLRSSPDVEPEPDVSSFYAALRSRSEELEDASATIRSRWTSGACVSRVAVAAGDWVRRMAYDDGVAAFGTASGGVGVARVSRAVADAPATVPAHPRAVEAQDLRPLHGDHDGGGVTALALRGDVCASGGRDGAVKAFAVARGAEPRLDGAPAALELAKNTVVSGVAIGESGRAIYAAGLDGSVKAWNRGDDGDWVETWSKSAPSPLLCVALDERRGALLVGSASGAAHAYSLADGSRLETWQAHRCVEFKSSTRLQCERTRMF